ncbi:hypothetical protein ACHAWO_009218 [Cyclotella atomus]|uniref:Sulfotransferase domain-containing protein n=1 Tax=Cyclotella atomus TaxID=382360 RepID=A0ABD3P2L5_9STRA
MVSKTKRSVTAVTFCTLCAVYLVNVTITISSIKSAPEPRQLQPLPPKKLKPDEHNRELRKDVIRSPYYPVQLPTYTAELAAQAVRPAPFTCGVKDESAIDPLTQQRPMFSFVHIYKTAGSTMREFFSTYAFICRKGWMCLKCIDLKASSIKSEGNWKNCQVEHAVDRNGKIERIGVKRKLYKHVNNPVLRDKFDLFGGHTRIGAGDNVLNKVGDIHPVRHVVFLRDPMDRYISGVLYQNQKKKKGWVSADFANLIKERVLGSRNAGDYWDRSLSYLLTPSQAEEVQSIKSSFIKTNTTEQYAEFKAMTVINNLMQYNVILGMTERMPQSMEILKHVLMANASKEQEALLDKKATSQSLNVSKKGGVTTSSVLEELKKDAEFMIEFGEFVKYEKMINDFAMNMHLMQHEQVVYQSKLTL